MTAHLYRAFKCWLGLHPPRALERVSPGPFLFRIQCSACHRLQG